MADNLNVNDNLHKWNVVKAFKEEPPEDMIPFHEEITICKTEVKEEVYDFETTIDNIEHMNVKEEPTASLENNFNEENLEVIKTTEQLLNEDLDAGHCELNLSFVNHDGIRTKDKPFKCTYKNCRCTPEQEQFCKCDTCGYASTARATLNRHILAKHSGEQKKYKCGHCNYAAHTKDAFERHIRIHTNEKPFVCTYKNCRCAPGHKGLCKCDMCLYATTNNYRLKMHVLVHHSAEQKKYKCKDCNYAAHLKVSLLQHIRNHANEKPFRCTYKNCKCTFGQDEICECDTCEYATADKASLRKHILVKHSGAPKKHKCRYCNYATHTKASLVLHNRIHTNEKPFQCTYKDCKCAPGQEEICECDTCGYAATDKATLKRHVLVKHSGEPKKYKCRDCKYDTHTKRSLMLHNRIHTNDRPFQCTYKNCRCPLGQEEICECDTCEFATSNKDSLKHHVLVKHSGTPKNYKCRDCNYSTYTKSSLAVHNRTHTKKSLVLHSRIRDNQFRCRYKNCTCAPGQEKFCKCDMCGYVATESYRLKMHELVEHSKGQKSINVKSP